MPSIAAARRRRVAGWAAVLLCGIVSISIGAATARGAAADLLTDTIATTKGSYLVCNFGPGHPMRLLNGAGSWYELNNGGL